MNPQNLAIYHLTKIRNALNTPNYPTAEIINLINEAIEDLRKYKPKE